MVVIKPQSYFEMNNIRPLWRGKIHEYAFYGSVCLLMISIMFAKQSYLPALAIYFATALIQYGVSAYYNQKMWKCPQKEKCWQRIDHACIYLLMAGHYTGACLIVLDNNINENGFLLSKWNVELLYIGWIFTVCGIVKTLIFRRCPVQVDVIAYIGIGSCPVFVYWYHICRILTMRDILLWLCSAGFYVIGSIVFVAHKPDPLPSVFGSHEIFHCCTVLAQICYSIPVFLTMNN